MTIASAYNILILHIFISLAYPARWAAFKKGRCIRSSSVDGRSPTTKKDHFSYGFQDFSAAPVPQKKLSAAEGCSRQRFGVTGPRLLLSFFYTSPARSPGIGGCFGIRIINTLQHSGLMFLPALAGYSCLRTCKGSLGLCDEFMQRTAILVLSFQSQTLTKVRLIHCIRGLISRY
ncbi:hypothetical protein F5X96DRAFT_217249 [Biscogniauxia mediterranea]|nr:hypothetical protein F5X96DRAFT_217249 [Biscogniauxia mediterranea]